MTFLSFLRLIECLAGIVKYKHILIRVYLDLDSFENHLFRLNNLRTVYYKIRFFALY